MVGVDGCSDGKVVFSSIMYIRNHMTSTAIQNSGETASSDTSWRNFSMTEPPVPAST